MRVESFSFRSINSNGTFEPVPARHAEGKVDTADASFTQQDLQAAESNGFVKGYNEGMAAGIAQMNAEQRERDNATLAIVQVMVRRIEEMVVQHQDFLSQQAERLGELALAIARKVVGDAISAQAHQVIEPVVMQCLQTFVGQPRFVVTLHPDLVEPLRERIGQQAGINSVTAEVVFQANATMPYADCRVEWQGGSAQLDQKKMWQEIESIILTRPAVEVAKQEHELLQSAARLPGHDEAQTL